MNESVDTPGNETSALRGAGGLVERIEKARLELLDLSTRNRLLHTPRGGRAKIIEVVNELAKAMYETLVIKSKRFTFASGRTASSASPADLDLDIALGAKAEEALDESALVEQPEVELDETGRVLSHSDDQLQTRMTSANLQKRLLDLYIDAKTLEEEQGVNILYLAIGYLKWRAPTTPDEDRFAPLVLVPVHLERSNAGERFHLRWSGDEIQANLSLQLYLQRQFGMKLPDILESEGFDIDDYLDQVVAMVMGKSHWAVQRDDAVLGLFSFAKFMMYRDLDPAQWSRMGGFQSLPMLRGVVSDGFPGAKLSPDDAKLDPIVPPVQMLHVLDCDSSQALVVHDARQGTNILVQGPPGTGKSQTIANIVAAAVADGKRVLFVAEKMAALEVVKRRLDQTEIGVACLELHSNKANKRALLEELRRTWQLGQPRLDNPRAVIQQLTERRDELNEHAERMHRVFEPARLTPYQVFGHLVRLRREGHTTRVVGLDGAISWAPHQMEAREAVVRDLVARIDDMGLPNRHAWMGIGIRGLMPNERDRILEQVEALGGELDRWRTEAAQICTDLELSELSCFHEIAVAVDRALRLVAAPQIGPDALLAVEWDLPGSVEDLLNKLVTANHLSAKALELANESALSTNWSSTKQSLLQLASSFTLAGELATVVEVNLALDRSLPDLARLGQLLGEHASLTLDSATRLITIGERAASVPQIEREALVAHIWDRGVDAVEELIDAVERLQRARRHLEGVFRETAWDRDLEQARAFIATLGGSWLRVFNGSWRRSNRLVRSLLVDPKYPSEQLINELDELIAAQAARKKIHERDAQGSEAFGAGWQRERSDTAFLRGVAAWMRSLRPLGNGVRERLAEVADRQLASELAIRLRPLLEESKTRLTPINEALIGAGKIPWGEETVLRRVPLMVVSETIKTWCRAAESTRLLSAHASLTVESALAEIEQIMQAQRALQELEVLSALGFATMGQLWRGISSDFEALQAAYSWVNENPDLRRLAANTNDSAKRLRECRELEARAGNLAKEVNALFKALDFDGPGRAAAIENDALSEMSARLERWCANPEGLPQWVAYINRAKDAEGNGLTAIVAALADGRVPTNDAIGLFQLAYYEAVLAMMLHADKSLASLDGQKLSQLVTEFSQLDWDRMRLARRQVASSHHKQLPQRGGAAGPTAVLLGEMSKKQKHMAIRQLMERCAPAIQALKPVFMMSPLSVAQFLLPGALEFDLLVIDEASQVQPVDALGSVARAKQLVIVGDERQLPPTRFFAKVLGDSQDDDESNAQAADVESILGLCRARGLPERMLRWHYRSRHQSLIAVSNQQFYENQLLIVPSPFRSEAGMGLRLNHFADAVYDRGNTRTNPVEAKAVASAVIEHAGRTPQLSLGVATFSTQQRRAIFDELEVLRRQHPETEGFFAAHGEEPFFVKSLENIQGDERDVIFISVGYGRDSHGHMTMNFGPLTKDGGERRLNVLISRAKSRCEVFSSITDDDIDVERGRGKGVAAFKLFLHYARTGRLTIQRQDQEKEDRVLEMEIATALKERGIDVHERVGIAGLFVDLAVADPENPGRYVLGIECDGSWYRDARSARDRERLREAALRDKGWAMHRVWASEWFHRPQAELEKLIAAIEKAKVDAKQEANRDQDLQQRTPVDVQTVERGEYVEIGLADLDDGVLVESYVEASIYVPRQHYELHTVPDFKMAEIVRQVVQVEGPIHRAEVVARIRDLWGLQRAGGRIQSAVEVGIASALERRLIHLTHHNFLSLADQPIRIRDRSDVQSNTLRRPDYLPPQEIDAVALAIVRANLGATLEELVLHISRKLGYRSTSAQLRALFEDRVNDLLQNGKLRASGELFIAGE
jgi:very-short-patch-repair endonuclease